MLPSGLLLLIVMHRTIGYGNGSLEGYRIFRILILIGFLQLSFLDCHLTKEMYCKPGQISLKSTDILAFKLTMLRRRGRELSFSLSTVLPRQK